MTLKAAVSPAVSLTNFRSRVNLPEASTSPVEVLLEGGEEVGREAEVEGASVDEEGRAHVEVGGGRVQVLQPVLVPDVGVLVDRVSHFTSIVTSSRYGDSSQAH